MGVVVFDGTNVVQVLSIWEDLVTGPMGRVLFNTM